MTSTNDFNSAASPLPRVPVTLDTKGRVRTSLEQRRGILAEFERSGISAAQFAKVSGIKYSTFAGWLQRQRRAKKPAGQNRPVRLLEAVMEQAQGGAASSASPVVVRLPDGSRIEIADAKQIPLAAALVRALARSC